MTIIGLFELWRPFRWKMVLSIFLLLFTMAAKSQGVDCDLCNPNLDLRNDVESPLAFLPIQQNLLITEDRTERITLKLREGSSVDQIEGRLLYRIGNEERMDVIQDLIFTTGESNEPYPIFHSDPAEMIFEDWIETYKVTQANLSLTFYEDGAIIAEESYPLSYITIDPNYLNTLQEPQVVFLLPDSTIVHLGNSIYVQLEKVRKKHIDPNSHFLDGGHGSPLEISPILDSIWQQPFFVDYYTKTKGLDEMLPTVFAISIMRGNGNSFFAENKAGMLGFSVLLTNRTFNHEMLHQYFPWFTRETISPELGIDVQSHHHVIFTGQTGFGFGQDARLPLGYPVLCEESFDLIENINGRFTVIVTEDCNPNFVTEVDGLPHNVHSFYELFIMGLTDFSEINFPFYYGATNVEQEYEDPNESITWSFDELKSIDEETFLSLHADWYAEKEDQFPGFFNAQEKNMLFLFFGTSPLTSDEYKVLSFISDELTKVDLSMAVPEFEKEGNFKYGRYLSYNKATLGLGHLTNEFPLPPNVVAPCTYNGQNLIIDDDPISSGIYAGEVSITSAGKVTSGNSVTFKAGAFITLQPGFQVQAGASFRGFIEECGAQNVAILPGNTSPPLRSPRLTIEAAPNPFRTSTILRFSLPETTEAGLIIYDINGRLISLLKPYGILEAGPHELTFHSEHLNSGIYYAILVAGRAATTQRLVLIR